MGEFPRSEAWLRERLSFSEAQLAETREMLEVLPESLDLVLEIYGPEGACAALRLGEERAVVHGSWPAPSAPGTASSA